MKRVVIAALLTISSAVNMHASNTPTEKEKLLTKLEAVCDLTDKLLKTDLSAGTVKVLTEHYQELNEKIENEKIKDEKFKKKSTALGAIAKEYRDALDARTKLIKDLCAQHGVPTHKASVTSSYQEPVQATTPTESTTTSTSETKQPAGGILNTQQLPALCLAALVCVFLPYLIWPS